MKPRIPTSYEKNQIFNGMWEKDVKDNSYRFGAYTTGIKVLPFPELGKTVGESGWQEQALTRDVLNVLSFGCVKFEVHIKHSSENV